LAWSMLNMPLSSASLISARSTTFTELSGYMITSASKKAIKVEVKPHGEEILKELRAIGNNVNQIARAVNSNPNLETKKLANNLIAINDLLVKLKKEWSTNGNSKGNKGNGEEPRENN